MTSIDTGRSARLEAGESGARIVPFRTAEPGAAPSTAVDEPGAARSPVPLFRRWTINGDFLALQPTGVARYAREVTMALDGLVAARHPLTAGLEIDLVAPREGREPLPLKAIPLRILPEFGRPRLPQFWVQAQLPAAVPGGLLSFCNLAPVRVKRQIVCMHDLHTRLMPESYGFAFRWVHRLLMPALGRRVARVTTVSQLSARHLVEFGVAPENKIVVTYNGADHAARWQADRSSFPDAATRPYALAIGRSQKYKNVALLLELAPLLDAMGIDLWMAGDIDLGAAPLPPNLRMLGRISDDDFAKALQGALCFLFPSRIEGFGLPAVEAMTWGCPVVASTAPCLPEVCGDAALYADPDDVVGWAQAVRRLRDDPGLRRRTARAGRTQARRYTWRGIAETYLDLMMEIDGASATRKW